MPISLHHFKATKGSEPIYSIGLADKLVTIRSQQVRAICLAELLHLKTPAANRRNLAIIGGGIAGLTLSAKLLQRGWVDITIFERLNDLLAVQNGCDTRWIHPMIIDWPQLGARDNDAKLSLLNWEADTASNVSYLIESKWAEVVKRCVKSSVGKPVRVISVLLGVTHLKISVRPPNSRGRKRQYNFPMVEWIRDNTVDTRQIAGNMNEPSGQNSFTHVVLATGFGIEKGAADSYWRNESLGQLQIDGAQRRFLISGLGDGAISDLLRLTTKHFRPDRVLDELALTNLEAHLRLHPTKDLLNSLESLEGSRKKHAPMAQKELRGLREYFLERCRDDTYVVLHALGKSGFREAFRRSSASVLHKVFLYALYKNGAFQYIETIRRDQEEDVAYNLDIPVENIIRRHGVDRQKVVRGLFVLNRVGAGKSVPEVSLSEQPIEECEKYLRILGLAQALGLIANFKSSMTVAAKAVPQKSVP